MLSLRLSVLRRRRELDRALANGADPAADPALALRACQLTAPAERRALAAAIGHLIDAAEEPPGAWPLDGPSPPLRRETVLAARHALLELAALLAQSPCLSPQAAALAAHVVWDRASPIYSTQSERTLTDLAAAALAC